METIQLKDRDGRVYKFYVVRNSNGDIIGLKTQEELQKESSDIIEIKDAVILAVTESIWKNNSLIEEISDSAKQDFEKMTKCIAEIARAQAAEVIAARNRK